MKRKKIMTLGVFIALPLLIILLLGFEYISATTEPRVLLRYDAGDNCWKASEVVFCDTFSVEGAVLEVLYGTQGNDQTDVAGFANGSSTPTSS